MISYASGLVTGESPHEQEMGGHRFLPAAHPSQAWEQQATHALLIPQPVQKRVPLAQADKPKCTQGLDFNSGQAMALP